MSKPRHPDASRDPAPSPPAGALGDLVLPAVLPVLPLRGSVLFPGVVMPVLVGREPSRRLVTEALEGNRFLAVATLRDSQIDEPSAADLHATGTLARIIKVLRLPNGNLNVIVQGLRRVGLADVGGPEPYFTAACSAVEEAAAQGVEVEAHMVSTRRMLERLVLLSSGLPAELEGLALAASRPGDLADIIAAHLATTVEEKQQVLDTPGEQDRSSLVLTQLSHQVQVLELSQKIESEVQGEIDRGQREMYLRERLRAIKRELGEEEDDADIDELGRRIEESSMPEDVTAAARLELGRLARMSPAAAEHNVLRTYLDWLLDMPWGKTTKDNLDLTAAAVTLDEDHYDLEKVKKRIIEYLAVRRLKPEKRGPILCFIGPPGVGKTSLGRSIARTLEREFVRLSLGGVHDEAEIRGHRRTYVGAMPGRIIQGIKRAGSMNPVFMLDEIDKIGQDFRGDPSAALLEVLDPEQNDTFSDHYLEVDFDLSRVLFIGTANVAEDIPAVLRDRMEILELPGYTSEEKVHIAQRFLVPRQLDDHGLTEAQLSFEDASIDTIVRDYTEEAGVRGLEREIAAICRAEARIVAEALDADTTETLMPRRVTVGDLHAYLGPVKYFSELAERTAEPGVAVALAWTASGGDILFIEATRMKGKGELRLTGQLGEIMKESAMAAMSFLRGRAESLGIDEKAFRDHDVHVHVPAGATPKDGPSAGITMLVALASLFTGRPVASDLGMTGELTLRGLVLPVGGIKNKVLAARRAGLRRVLLPTKNEKDLEEIPESVRSGLEFVFAERVDEVLEIALTAARPAPRKTSSAKVPRGSKKPRARRGPALS